MKNKLGIIIAGILFAGGLTACTSNEPTTADAGVNEGYGVGYNEDSTSIPGTYKGIESGFALGEKKNDEEFSLVLNEDGTGINKRNNTEFELTWKMEDGQFKMTDKYLGITIDYTGVFDGKKLTLFNGDPEDELTYEYVYEKE